MAKRSKSAAEPSEPPRTRKRAKLEADAAAHNDNVDEEEQTGDVESSDYEEQGQKTLKRKRKSKGAKATTRPKKTGGSREDKAPAGIVAHPKKKRAIKVKGPIKFLDFPLDIVEEVACKILSRWYSVLTCQCS